MMYHTPLHQQLDQLIVANAIMLRGYDRREPIGQIRTVVLSILAEVSAMAQMENPRPAVEEMLKRFRADLEGVRIPPTPQVFATPEDWESVDPAGAVASVRVEFVNVLTRVLAHT